LQQVMQSVLVQPPPPPPAPEKQLPSCRSAFSRPNGVGRRARTRCGSNVGGGPPHALPVAAPTTTTSVAAAAVAATTAAPADAELVEEQAPEGRDQLEVEAPSAAEELAVEDCSATALAAGADDVAVGAPDVESVLEGLARILGRGFGAAECTEEGRTCFHAKSMPKVSLVWYLQRMRKNLPCSDCCFAVALVYMDRVAQRDRGLVATEWTCHRLVALMLAFRFWDDPGEEYHNNEWFAKLGGIRPTEMAELEIGFLRLLDWRLFVTPEEFEFYVERLRSAAAGGRSEGEVPAHAE